MKNDDKKFDDHHCSVIERESREVELAECDSDSDNKEDRNNCHAQVRETSQKREQACKFS
jgi:hypothetical protein